MVRYIISCYNSCYYRQITFRVITQQENENLLNIKGIHSCSTKVSSGSLRKHVKKKQDKSKKYTDEKRSAKWSAAITASVLLVEWYRQYTKAELTCPISTCFMWSVVAQRLGQLNWNFRVASSILTGSPH